PHYLLLPVDAADVFSENLEQISPDQRLGVNHYGVRRGDSIASVARKFHTSVNVIRELNDLTGGLTVGDDLRVPSAVSELPAKVMLAAARVDGHGRSLRRAHVQVVRRGDSLWTIARRNGMNVNTLASLNGMHPGDTLRAGQHIRLTSGSSGGSGRSGGHRRLFYTVREGDTVTQIAQAMHREGAELAFSYVNDKMKERVEPLAHSLGSRLSMPLDVTLDEQCDAAFERLAREWGGLDILVHAVAYAPREALTGSFLEATRREGFRVAHEVSSYSLTALAQRAQPLMAGRRGALLTLTYLGAVRSIPGYNVMGLAKASLEANVRFLAADLGPQGVRVNAISAGPIKTLAAAGIPGFRKMLARVAEVAPLRRNVTLEDVGNAAAFLCSDLAAGITGEVLYVDSGFSTVGMSFPLEAEG